MDALRVKFSPAVTFEEVEKAAPAGYSRVMDGASKKAGRIGSGIAGEPLVILLPNDDGAWFDALVATKG